MSEGAELVEVVVERSKWHRGKGTVGSALLTLEGKMCCLGFVARQSGYALQDMFGCGTPASLAAKTPFESPRGLVATLVEPEPGFLRFGAKTNTLVCAELINANDDKALTDANREATLQDLALKAGFRLRFVD